MMHISQPSVSRLIADLEQAIGFPLFLRSGRGLAPTVEAKTFYQGVEGMFVGIDRLQELADAIRTTNADQINVGTIQSIAAIELPKAVGVLRRHLPDIRLMIQCRNTPAILEAVQMHQIELGIVGREPPYDGVEVLYQTAVPYVCLIPEDHELADENGPVDLEKLADTEEFVTFGGAFPDSMMAMDRELAERLQRRSRLSATNMPVTGALVRETGVLAICDPFTAEQTVRTGGVVFRSVQQELTYHVSLIAPGRDRLSRAALALVDVLSGQLDSRVAEVRKYR